MSSPELIKIAAASLKCSGQWRLRHAANIPEHLVPANFMLKEEVAEIFSEMPDPRVVKLIARQNHKTALVRYKSAADPNDWLCQIYTGKPIRSGLILGRIGCVDLIRSRLAEELEFSSENNFRVSNEMLAEYLSPNAPEAEMRFLDRLNTGQPVSEPSVQHLCRELFIDIGDIAFSVPSVYKHRKDCNFSWACSLWAESWSEWSQLLVEGFVRFDVPSYNIYFKVIQSLESEQYRPEINMALGPLYNSLIAYRPALTPIMKRRLLCATEKLRELDFDCWVSYREGLRGCEPNLQPKLFLTIGKSGVIEGSVELRGHVRFTPEPYIESVPKRLRYAR